MNPRHTEIAARAGWRCEYCRAPEVIFNIEFEVEHIVPSSRGGGELDSNLALACHACNLHKLASVEAVDLETDTAVLLFNPRVDNWFAHFLVTPAAEIVGITPVGRVTILRLRMNRPTQLLARRQWIQLGLFP